jgi:glycosyltransferase involved in cell wall biosynthesis
MKELLKRIYQMPVWTTSWQLWLCVLHRGHRRMMGQRFLWRKIAKYLSALPDGELTSEKKEVLDYLRNTPVSYDSHRNVFPYPYTKKYMPEQIVVFKDGTNGLPYVLHENKKLYFRRGTSDREVRTYYASLLSEQDADSPHCYETDAFRVHEREVVIDAGVAEGNFSLSVVERAANLWLFEPDKSWIEPLQATFAPWKDKVVIINKMVSDVDDEFSVSLDNFDFGKDKVTFIKADIEGFERLLLSGASKLLFEQRPMRLVLCTYHRQDDAAVLERMLRSRGFQTEFSKRYMIFPDKRIAAPYLRRGLIRAQKTGNPLELDENCKTPPPKYSIVLPVFKTKYFNETFDSVAKQTFSDYEIVVMNDEADSDITWVKENLRVRYFENHPRLGPTQNWNRSLNFCRGEFVLMFSDDDILEPNFLEEVDKFLHEHNWEMDVVRVLQTTINERGDVCSRSAPGNPVETLLEYIYNQYFFMRRQLLQDIIFRREEALKIGGFKDFPRGSSADLLFLVEIAEKKGKVGNLNKTLGKYRVHGASLSFSKDKNYYFEILQGIYGFHKGVFDILKRSTGEYKKLAEIAMANHLQASQDTCYEQTLVRFGFRSLWRLHRSAEKTSNRGRSLRHAMPVYLWDRCRKLLTTPTRLFSRRS